MKTLLILCTILSIQAFSLESPFKSSIRGIELPNAHFVGKEKKLVRGMAPNKHFDDLLKLGITDVLIFKNQTKNEVDKEIVALKKLGIKKIYQIPFLWHDYSSYEETCEQTIQALALMREISRSSDRRLFFHCTVGEDRTGFLAGLWDILTRERSPKEAFQEQMCERGYARGNPNKPIYVVNEIRTDLTPLFVKMVRMIRAGQIRLDKLSKKVCEGIEVERLRSTPKCEAQKI